MDKNIMGSKKPTYFWLSSLSLTCLMQLSTIANANPIVETPTVQNITEDTNTNLAQLDLSYQGENTPVLIDFEKMKPISFHKFIKEHYLTVNLNKNEKLRATYLQGAYAINYTQKW